MGRKIQEDLPGEGIIELGDVPGMPVKAARPGERQSGF